MKAAIFDLDGTLLDTLEDLADSVNAVLGRHGWAEQPLDDFRYHIGDGPRVLFERALRAGGMGEAEVTREVTDELIVEYKAEYATRWDAKTQVYAGVAELLNGLSGRGVALAVLSNKPHEFTLDCVEGYLGRWGWEKVLGMRDGVAKKPDPVGVYEILEALEVEAGECVYFGDTATDMKTARAAGVTAVGCLWGFRDEAELRESGADFVIARPEEFLDIRLEA
ncbi:MAG: HAD family hydrolase [Verrucomicrobiota bacterium]